MVMDRLKAASELPGNQDPTQQFAIKHARAMLVDAGVKDPGMPVITPVEKQVVKTAETIKIYPEISLEEEWKRQAQKLAGFFAKELEFKTPEEYIATLPEFEPQPENWKGRLDTPVLVETRISVKRQCEIAGIQYLSDGLNKTDWNKKRKDYKTPTCPYKAWLDDGRNHMDRKPSDARSNLKVDELSGTELEGVALYISNPKILEHHYLDLPGTAVGPDRTACLRLWGGRPELDCYLVVNAHPKFGSVVRGRQK